MHFKTLGSTVEAFIDIYQGEYTLHYGIQVPKTTADGKVFLPSNFLIYCNICGEPWARRSIQEGPKTRWWAKDMPCQNCGFGFLWVDYDRAWQESMRSNVPLMQREMTLYKRCWDAGLKNYAAMCHGKYVARDLPEVRYA
jgi:hypothetical protein